MDPSTFFSLLFGSERFEPWIGELPWAQACPSAQAVQHWRIGMRCIQHVLQRHLAMQTDQFAKAMEKEGRCEMCEMLISGQV